MGPHLLSPRQSGFRAGWRQTITSTHLLDRARQYRLAAALTDDRRDSETFGDLAKMFDRLASDFRRLEQERIHRCPRRNGITSGSAVRSG
jgi:hypothetical protein